jgi:hypothetical protein
VRKAKTAAMEVVFWKNVGDLRKANAKANAKRGKRKQTSHKDSEAKRHKKIEVEEEEEEEKDGADNVFVLKFPMLEVKSMGTLSAADLARIEKQPLAQKLCGASKKGVHVMDDGAYKGPYGNKPGDPAKVLATVSRTKLLQDLGVRVAGVEVLRAAATGAVWLRFERVGGNVATPLSHAGLVPLEQWKSDGDLLCEMVLGQVARAACTVPMGDPCMRNVLVVGSQAWCSDFEEVRHHLPEVDKPLWSEWLFGAKAPNKTTRKQLAEALRTHSERIVQRCDVLQSKAANLEEEGAVDLVRLARIVDSLRVV